MMKKIRTLTWFLAAAFMLAPLSNNVLAQFRSEIPTAYGYSGTIFRTPEKIQTEDKMLGLFRFSMSHSYEMTVGSMGGNTFNQNYYTNTMLLQFSDQLQGRVDLSVAHSPFGNGLMNEPGGAKFFVRNAELNYLINPNTSLRLQYQQIPYSPYGFYRSPQTRHPFQPDPFYGF